MTQKILIFGFPHCGSSILKSIFGHIEEVEEIVLECMWIEKKTNKKFAVCKFPVALDQFFSEKYKDYIKIFIIRNPLFVFSSLNKRFNYKIPDDHCFDRYVYILNLFCKNKNTENVYTIRYEDLFENDYHNLKKIINNIGIKYDDIIFDNTKYTNLINDNIKVPKKKPKNIEHNEYRTWQINQTFVSKNDISKIDLSEIQKEQIINNHYVLKLYPDIKSFKCPKV